MRFACSDCKNRISTARSATRGQALAELVITLVVLVTLVIGVATLAQVCLRQQFLHRDVRLNAGESALARKTTGWVDPVLGAENRSDTVHRINAYTHLEQYTPALTSRLPMSQYTLFSRVVSDGDLGLEETKLEQTYLLDEAFIRLIYGKGSITLRESLTFPSTSGIWK